MCYEVVRYHEITGRKSWLYVAVCMRPGESLKTYKIMTKFDFYPEIGFILDTLHGLK